MCARPLGVAGRLPSTMSAISNGSRLHQKADGRSSSARRFRDLVRAFSADLGGNLSEADMALIRTAAGLTLKSELLQNAMAAGDHVDSDELIRLASTSRRALAAVSAKAIERQPGAGPTTLQEYIASRNAAADRDDEA